MPATRLSSSFRDPSGYLFHSEGRIYRQVNPGFQEDYEQMAASGFLQEAVERGWLIKHEEMPDTSLSPDGKAYRILSPEQLPFISYPYEWSFSQLKDAALLTLELQKLALEKGLWLKDASAYNVQFLRGRPVFIDTLSFEAYPEGRPWVAYQQFCKHFLAPLALMAHRHIDLGKLLRLYIDGIPLDLASAQLPMKTRLSLGLLMNLHLHARAINRHSGSSSSAKKASTQTLGKTGLLGVIDNLESTIRKLQWRPGTTEWGDYYQATNYSDGAHTHKAELIDEYISKINPRNVWDLGANTGRFSRIAADKGISTVAFDVDPVAVEKNYREIRDKGEENILPLIMDLTNPSTDLGWAGEERMSLRSRSPAGLVLSLALIHHLAISNNIPLDHIADFFASLGESLIIEFVPKQDSQVQWLLATRADIFPDYTQEGFERAFSRRFELVNSMQIQDSERLLYLYKRL